MFRNTYIQVSLRELLSSFLKSERLAMVLSKNSLKMVKSKQKHSDRSVFFLENTSALSAIHNHEYIRYTIIIPSLYHMPTYYDEPPKCILF